jgi:hypothetical protein
VKPWDVMITPEGEKMLLSIQDRRIRKLLKSRAMRLSTAPEKPGKPLKGELVGLRSVTASYINSIMKVAGFGYWRWGSDVLATKGTSMRFQRKQPIRLVPHEPQ